MKNLYHREILGQIKKNAGKSIQDAFLNNYLGNTHPRYPIGAPALRKIAKDWMKDHRNLTAKDFASLLTELVHGESSTEKLMAGVLLGYSTADQREFDPTLFDRWLDHLEGWAEVDAVCTGKYTVTEIKNQWRAWKPLLKKFSKSKNVNKRRASLVFFCSPLSNFDDEHLAETALLIVDRLKQEKEILITKAISWVLRSMVKYNRKPLESYLKENAATLPKIALRETLVKLETGKKTRKSVS